ncbi:ketopantoate reductase family protein [Gordonia insulae]|uniref:2-dehydropantoate 2-reductase n=1 Tax=Gordonia insulae TaxID=2420509 RepID=A0A3G8JKN0_9ACTN|nr:2-dehydropantoate 2-reductase [Gordonia insulae]AZG45641.1 hypothetical protein D7316_02237 [Gordonia insulae]
MSILIVGAGATGGYLADRLTAGGRNVTVLVRERTQQRLAVHGLQIRDRGTTRNVPVRSVTRDDLRDVFDVVIVAVRSDTIETAIADFTPAVGADTMIVPVGNGVAHVTALRTAFGDHRVVGAAVEMATSVAADGVVDVTQPGVRFTIGALDGSVGIGSLVAELDVEGIDVTVVDDALTAVWRKFLFISSTAVLTCLARGTIADIAADDNGAGLADQVVDETEEVVAATSGLPSDATALRARLRDRSWDWAPSMYRDLVAGRRAEVEVLREMAGYARLHSIRTPLLDAAVVAIAVSNRRVSNRRVSSRPQR